ncbi:MAG: ribosome recycling factor [Candidatus Margulisbacteria bacterium]|nr:ribosome recycling factor [Candidatus Margulisiibacteriota bacterium]
MKEFEEKLEKSLENLRQHFTTVRTGRANPDLLSKIKVDCYGSSLPVKQVASVNVHDSNALVITPFDRSTLGDIEKSLMKSDLGLNPVNDGHNLRLVFPPLTEERRKELDKIIKKMAEEGRIATRNIRRDFMDKMKKNKDLSEDEHKRIEHEIQKITDKYIGIIDSLLKTKEKEIMEI